VHLHLFHAKIESTVNIQGSLAHHQSQNIAMYQSSFGDIKEWQMIRRLERVAIECYQQEVEYSLRDLRLIKVANVYRAVAL